QRRLQRGVIGKVSATRQLGIRAGRINRSNHCCKSNGAQRFHFRVLHFVVCSNWTPNLAGVAASVPTVATPTARIAAAAYDSRFPEAGRWGLVWHLVG